MKATEAPVTDRETWRTFTLWVAAACGVALVFGFILSYSSVYQAAYDGGFAAVWLSIGSVDVRPAHLFPLTLDVPLLVGYAGTIALAGRRDKWRAQLVLVACSVATIGLQVAAGAGIILDSAAMKAVIHGWPPAMAIITADLFVKVLQALGFLRPPIEETVRPSWPARAWAWAMRAAGDIRAAKADPTPVPQVVDTGQDRPVDSPPSPQVDTRVDSRPAVRGAEVVDIAGRKLSKSAAVAKVIDDGWTQADAAKAAGVSTKTIQRAVSAAKQGHQEQDARAVR